MIIYSFELITNLIFHNLKSKETNELFCLQHYHSNRQLTKVRRVVSTINL